MHQIVFQRLICAMFILFSITTFSKENEGTVLLRQKSQIENELRDLSRESQQINKVRRFLLLVKNINITIDSFGKASPQSPEYNLSYLTKLVEVNLYFEQIRFRQDYQCDIPLTRKNILLINNYEHSMTETESYPWFKAAYEAVCNTQLKD